MEVLLPRVLSISVRIIYLRAYQSVWDQVGVSSTGGTQKRMDGGTKFIRRVCENLLFTVDRIFGRFPKVFGIEFCKDVGGILACDANQFRAFARCRFDSLVFDWKSNDLSPYFWTEVQ